MRAITGNIRSLSSKIRSKECIERISKDDTPAVHTLLDELAEDVMGFQQQIEDAEKLYATYYTVTEFALVLALIALLAGTYELSTRVTELRYLLFIVHFGVTSGVLLYVICLVFMVGANITAACDNYLFALRDLGLRIPVSSRDSYDGFSQLYSSVEQLDLAFRPHGIRVSRAQVIVVVNFLATIALSTVLYNMGLSSSY